MSSVTVSNISPHTTEHELRDFFSFCGKIEHLSLTPAASAEGTQSATVTFERDTAAKTALLLDNTELGTMAVKVVPTASLDDLARGKVASHSDETDREEEIRQEDKPRSAILAEYLSHGYVIGDNALQKGIALDKQHGISTRFTSVLNKTLNTIDTKLHATDRARAVDTSYGVTGRAVTARTTVMQYFEKALSTPTGLKVRSFYVQGEKQVLDIHKEARRLADLRKAEKAGSEGVAKSETVHCTCEGSDGTCKCTPGTCQCAGCNTAKTPVTTQAASVASAVKETVAGTSEKV